VASTLEPLIFMAEQGMGIAYLPDFAIGRQLREGILVTVLDDYTDRSGPLRVLWPSSRHLAPKLRVFVDFLAANLVPAVEGEGDRAGDSAMAFRLGENSCPSQSKTQRLYRLVSFRSLDPPSGQPIALAIPAPAARPLRYHAPPHLVSGILPAWSLPPEQ
jgi:LysR substrate binding domain